jgi:hypothetical protein
MVRFLPIAGVTMSHIEIRYTLLFLICRRASCGVGLRFEMMSPASILGPSMYPFATGATGRYFPWLREFGGRPNTGQGSLGKGTQRRYLVSQRGISPRRPRRWYLSGLVSTTKASFHQHVSCIGSARPWRASWLGPAGSGSVAQSLPRVPSFGARQRTDRGFGVSGRVRDEVAGPGREFVLVPSSLLRKGRRDEFEERSSLEGSGDELGTSSGRALWVASLSCLSGSMNGYWM